MAIVNLKSNLSQIRKSNPTPDKTTQQTSTSDNFTNVNAQGFTLNRNGQRNTEFKIGSQDTTNFLDSRGNAPVKSTTERPYPTQTQFDTSRLLILHQNSNNFLSNLYNQVDNNDSPLGMRSTNRFGFNQPFIIRKVDERWGIDDISPSGFGSVAQKVFNASKNFIDDAGNIVFGRSPNEYVGNAIGSISRTAKFLGTTKGIAFLAKQNILVRRNKQKQRTDVRYGIGTDLSLESNRSTNQLGDLIKRTQDTRSYNPLSLGSLPGVVHIPINNIGGSALLTAYENTIKDNISRGAIQYASEKAVKLIDIGLGKLGGLSVGGKTISQRFSDFRSAADEKLNYAIIAARQDTRELLNSAGKTGDVIRFAGEVITSSAKSILDKTAKINIDRQGFSETGRDKVNLIPYGSDKYLGRSYEDLDFIPFKFKDARSGDNIVFRAILSGITDTFSPEYSGERYIGRPDQVYVYQGTNRQIAFTFDVYPKSDKELPILWEKLDYLAGLTYPRFAAVQSGGQAPIAPFCKLTIGDMYRDAPGYIDSLTYTVMDETTWETTFTKLPKYVQASVTYTYVGDRLPTTEQKMYDIPWKSEKKYRNLATLDGALRTLENVGKFSFGKRIDVNNLSEDTINTLIK